jgi:hypothetical protein
VKQSGAAFTKCFYNSSTIFLQFFYDYSLRAFTVFSAQNPSQPQQGKSFPEFGMHQILLQFFHKIAIESWFPYEAKQPAGNNCGKIVERFGGPSSGSAAGKDCGRIVEEL